MATGPSSFRIECLARVDSALISIFIEGGDIWEANRYTQTVESAEGIEVHLRVAGPVFGGNVASGFFCWDTGIAGGSGLHLRAGACFQPTRGLMS